MFHLIAVYGMALGMVIGMVAMLGEYVCRVRMWAMVVAGATAAAAVSAIVAYASGWMLFMLNDFPDSERLASHQYLGTATVLLYLVLGAMAARAAFMFRLHGERRVTPLYRLAMLLLAIVCLAVTLIMFAQGNPLGT